MILYKLWKKILKKVTESSLKDRLEGVFWDQQIKNARVKDSRQVRWHPLMIKWCLNMRFKSGAAYHAMRTAGFIYTSI